MLLTSLPLPLLRALSFTLLSTGVAVFLTVRLPALQSRARHYVRRLDRDLAYLRYKTSARQLVAAQAALSALALVALGAGYVGAASGLAVVAASVVPYLTQQRARRTNAIERQLDGWLFGLASTLRATPAPGLAIEYSAALVSAPLREELETLVKEQRVGVALDEAIARLGARIGSRTVLSALGTLRIGQASGGDIPQILERSAATLREMGRLEGVVRTRTAESKAQAFLLGVLPFPLVALLNWLDPGFLLPLMRDLRGISVIAVAVALWLASIFVARRILNVDI